MATEEKTTTKRTTKTIAKEEKELNPNATTDTEQLLAKIAELQLALDEAKKAESPMVELEPIIDTERMIPFISLVSGSCMLKGSAPRPYEIEGQYQTRSFTETEAKIIVSQMGNYMRSGYVYIDDAKFVKDVGLSEVYKTMLSPKDLQGLFNNTPNTVINIYENASDGQQNIILDLIREKQAHGYNVDANILTALSKLSGRDLLTVETDEE